VPLPDEPQTAILHQTAAPGEAATRAQIHTTSIPAGAVGSPATGNRVFPRKLVITLGALIILLGAGFFGFKYFSARAQINSIAVLPFQNADGNPESEYISDGLSESLIYRLSQIPELRVSPRSSAFRYKGQDVDAENVGSELGVDAVLSGRVIQRGDSLTISVDLVDIRNRKTLWGEQFERKISELLATQREIAATITQKMQLKLSRDDATGITKRYTESNDAYQHYLLGRFYWNKRTPESLPKAVEQFQAAAEADPNFALAYSGLADVYVIGQYYTRRWEGDYGLPAAAENAQRAIALDPTLAEPHATLGMVYEFQWNWDESEKEFRRSIDLNPNYATARQWFSRFLRVRGRYDEAMAEIKKAQEADPLSGVIAENVVQNLLEKGDVDGAIEQCHRTIDLDPQFWVIHSRYAAALIEKGQKEEGLAEAEKAFEMVNHATFLMGFVGYAQAVAGHRDGALATARELEKRYAAGEGDGVRIASVYLGLGDKDKVFEWLEKDFKVKRPSLVEIRQEPEFKSLRDDQRFHDLLKRMNLPE
jgi:serine/threonine-protein kinase